MCILFIQILFIYIYIIYIYTWHTCKLYIYNNILCVFISSRLVQLMYWFIVSSLGLLINSLIEHPATSDFLWGWFCVPTVSLDLRPPEWFKAPGKINRRPQTDYSNPQFSSQSSSSSPSWYILYIVDCQPRCQKQERAELSAWTSVQ